MSGFIPFSLLTISLTIVIAESSRWLAENILRSAGIRKSKRAWINALLRHNQNSVKKKKNGVKQIQSINQFSN